ncbi:hypothetical protein GTP55_18435 [Duganella sp. FT109W]|uniref:Uncharacterized protein n=1 Tax=Duganella margarita TaxID=2692170 RepID=A0ABW9WM46_9BURK|nr:hypothetical protein [Duganella margarita]MYN41344.1 hypothetical protein [Duganella margarita]
MRLLLIKSAPMSGESREDVLRREDYAGDYVHDGDGKKPGNRFIQAIRDVGHEPASA